MVFFHIKLSFVILRQPVTTLVTAFYPKVTVHTYGMFITELGPGYLHVIHYITLYLIMIYYYL